MRMRHCVSGSRRRNVSATLAVVLTRLSDDQQQAIALYGTPLTVEDIENPTRVFVLLEMQVRPDPSGGFLASVAGIAATGGGESRIEAGIALTHAMRASMDL